jgi:hypothetical protein
MMNHRIPFLSRNYPLFPLIRVYRSHRFLTHPQLPKPPQKQHWTICPAQTTSEEEEEEEEAQFQRRIFRIVRMRGAANRRLLLGVPLDFN